MRRLCYVLLTVILLVTAQNADAEEISDELFPLGIIPPDSQIVTTSRIPRPISRVAENVTVITDKRIADLNAHTLADVLQTVPGIQLDYIRTPGNMPTFSLQGGSSRRVLLLLDGVPQNELTSNWIDVGSIPAHYIERIEIIRGAASAAWGPALAGVINVITKSPDPDRTYGGSGFASYGEKGTSDLQLDASGTAGPFGYYLSGGNIHSRGLLANTGLNNNNLFGKIAYELPESGVITLGLDYRVTDRDTVATADPYLDYRENITNNFFSGYLSLNKKLANDLSLDLLYREKHYDNHNIVRNFASTGFWSEGGTTQEVRGATAKLNWGDSRRNLVAGVEYEHARLSQNGYIDSDWDLVLDTPLVGFKRMDRYGIFTNGAWTVGRLTILPGIRYDKVNITSDNLSYTLGVTYQLTDSTTLRTYYANAYSLPFAMFSEDVQRVNTVQAGFETTALPYLWLKGTFFHNIEKKQTIDFSTLPETVYFAKFKRQGGELELKTTPYHGFSLGGGYTYTFLNDAYSGKEEHTYPKNLAKIELNYGSSDIGLTGVLSGNYVWWHGADGWLGHYNPVIWDISLTQKLMPSRDMSPELFFSGHNIFNGSQYYLVEVYNNAHRWIEGGVRFKF